MQTFKEHQTNTVQIQEHIVDMLILSSEDIDFEDEMLTEGVIDKFADKLGLKIHRGGDGLIQQLRAAGKAIFQLFVAAIKGDTKKVREIAKSLNREDVAKFIFNLDNATLHILAIPIHTLNAITGWDIEPKSALDKAKHTAIKIKVEIERIKGMIVQYFDRSVAVKHLKALRDIANSIPNK